MKNSIVFLFILPQFLFAQNIIPNCSFEDLDTTAAVYYSVSAGGSEPIRDLPTWRDCSGYLSNIYKVRSGYYSAFVVCYNNQPDNYRTYLQTRLCETLQAGKIYHFKMYCKGIEQFSTPAIGVAFLADSVKLYADSLGRFKNYLVQVKPAFCNRVLNSTNDNVESIDWDSVQHDYVAKGNEKYILIGNFNDDKNTKLSKGVKKADDPLRTIYIDDLSLFTDGDTTDCSNDKNSRPNDLRYFQTGKYYVVNRVYYDTSIKLLNQSCYDSLAFLADYLETHKTLRVEIDGYCYYDAILEDKIKLTYQKAKAAADFLVAKGVDPKRIICKGFGDSKPLADNNTQEGRAENQRLEFILSY